MKNKTRGFEVVKDEMRKNKGVEITLPKRGTKHSAAYDFYSPITFTVEPNGKSPIIALDVKAYMQENEVLLLFVRSSIGIKKGLILSNGTGVIDSDYYSNESNDGNIGASFINTTNKPVTVEAGERIIQGMFVNFLTVDNENTDELETRSGGTGSTGVK